MRCPYCGAEVVGRNCVFCGSDLLEYIRKNNLSVEDFEPKKEDDPEKEEEKKQEEVKEKDRETDAVYVSDAIREMCSVVIEKYSDDFASYDKNHELVSGKKVKDRLFDVLHIPEGEEVYLIHDDTLFKNGKNGFAITESGFYCQEFLESFAVTEFDSIRSNDKIITGNVNVRMERNSKSLIYYAAGGDTLKELERICNKILDMLK